MIWHRPAIVFLGMGILVGGCKKENEFVAPPAPKVTVATPLAQDVTFYVDFTGRFESVEDVEIVARVSGYLQEIHFVDGQAVDKGTPLYKIDPREYQAAVDKAEGDLNTLKAEKKLAEVELQRYEVAFAKEGVSELEVIRARANVEKKAAEIMAAEATLERAGLDLSYTDVVSPIKGLVSRTSVFVGDVVGTGLPRPLTTVVRQDPIRLYFTASERALLASGVRFDRETRALAQDRSRGTSVYALLADGSLYDQVGMFDFIDNAVDPETGTIGIRAEFPNPEGVVTPGYFARIRIPVEVEADEGTPLLVPEAAIQRDSVGAFLLAVNDANEVVRLDVERGVQMGAMRVISSGLKGTDRVIIQGLQRARPGIEVVPEQETLEPVVQEELELRKPASGGEGREG